MRALQTLSFLETAIFEINHNWGLHFGYLPMIWLLFRYWLLSIALNFLIWNNQLLSGMNALFLLHDLAHLCFAWVIRALLLLLMCLLLLFCLFFTPWKLYLWVNWLKHDILRLYHLLHYRRLLSWIHLFRSRFQHWPCFRNYYFETANGNWIGFRCFTCLRNHSWAIGYFMLNHRICDWAFNQSLF
jgi:hypothetical protein